MSVHLLLVLREEEAARNESSWRVMKAREVGERRDKGGCGCGEREMGEKRGRC